MRKWIERFIAVVMIAGGSFGVFQDLAVFAVLIARGERLAFVLLIATVLHGLCAFVGVLVWRSRSFGWAALIMLSQVPSFTVFGVRLAWWTGLRLTPHLVLSGDRLAYKVDASLVGAGFSFSTNAQPGALILGANIAALLMGGWLLLARRR